MTCDRHPWGDDRGLTCVNDGPGHGHVFHGSTVPDKHDASEPTDSDEGMR